jgi:hypothetical protein
MTTDDKPQDTGASVTPNGLSQAEPQEGLGPSGFDPSRDGFDNARLGYVLARVTALAAKRAKEIAYGTWNPGFCSSDASVYASEVLMELGNLIAWHLREAAIAMEARQGLDRGTGLDGEAATARASEGGIAHD